MDKFGLNKNDFASYEEYRKEYNRLIQEELKTDGYFKEYANINKDKIKAYRKIYNKADYAANKDELNEKSKEWKDANKDKVKRYRDENKEERKVWYSKNLAKIQIRTKEYREKNKDKLSKLRKEWKQSEHGRGIVNALNAKRRAKKLKATPSWADLNKIKEIYKNCPKGYEVDHIIPLLGKNVCGLHVENNLQYLTHKKNRSKGNK